jgi:hypothetical protein
LVVTSLAADRIDQAIDGLHLLLTSLAEIHRDGSDLFGLWNPITVPDTGHRLAVSSITPIIS